MASAPYRPSSRQTGTVLAILVAGAGCTGSWRPSLEAVRVTAATHEFRLAAYLPARAHDERLYYRSSPDANPPIAPVEYRRISTPTSVIQGRLVGRPIPPLFECLTGSDDDAKRRAAALSAFLHGGPGWGFLFEPAVPVFPETIIVGRPVEAAARVTCVHRTGRRLFDGTITRRVTAEGIETVTTPAGMFENCLRLRVEMALRLHWGPATDTTEYIWLAPGTGEVRRIERLTGAFWFLFFATTAEYALVTSPAAADPDHVAPPPAPTQPAVRCSALLLDRLGPSPVLAGLYYEFAPPEIRRAEWHAIREPNPVTTERVRDKPSAASECPTLRGCVRGVGK